MGLIITIAISVASWLIGLIYYVVTDYIESRYTNKWYKEFKKLSAENQEIKHELQKYKWKYGNLE